MPDIDPIVIPLKVDSSQALTPIEEVEAKVNSQSTELSELKGGFEAPSTSFGQGLTEQLEVTENSLRRIIALRKKIDSAGSETERRQATRSFTAEYDRAGKIVEDLRASISGSNALFSSLGSELSEQFRIGIQSFMPKLMSEFKAVAVKLASSTGTTDDKSLVNIFKGSEAYRSIFGQLQQRNDKVFTDVNMTQMLRAMLPVAVPQYTRSRYVDWAQAKSSVASVRDLLPNSFANISLQQAPKSRQYSGNGRALTSDELISLQRIIKNNPYAAQEFERAGLMRRHNGLAYFNPYATTENVNALGGQIARMFEIGMRGAHSNGITNIEDPRHLDKLKYRDNLYVNSARKLATELSDTFQWMAPEHIDNVPATKYSPRNWKTLGEFRAKPRQATMEFIEFDAAQLGADGRISTPGNDPSAPHKYLRVNNSLMQSWLSKQRGATPFQHNGFNNNEIYMRLPVDELQDPQLPEERKQAIRNEMIRAVRTSPVLADGTRYTFSGLTSNHAVFTRSDLKEAIEAQDPTFFRNGEVRTSFDSFEHFGKALDASKKTRTEGEDIRKLYGTDLTGVKVVVGDLKKQTGLDGQNIISDTLVPESFQGRGMGAKATYQKVNFAQLFEMYPQLVNDRGEQVLPGGGIDGGDLVIPKDVGLVEDMSNIKTKHQYAGLTQEQVNQLRSQEIAEKGIFAKTTAAGHSTDTRYISAQAAATMQFGPEAKQYFHNVFLRELASLEDVGAVKSLLFSGDDYLSRLVQEDEGYLNSPEARTRIDEYRASLFARAGKGDILLPQGAANYSMLSAWLPDVLNKLVPAELLTDEQRAQSLRDNVAYFMSASDELGVFRNPATASGNLKQANKAADDYFQKTAQLLGVDPQAQYVDPQSVILKLMQGADLDGDTVFTTALKRNGEFGQIMSKVLIDTATSYKQLRESANRTDEQQERFNEQHRKDVGTEGKTYRIDPNDRYATEAERQQAAEDIVDHYIGSQAASAKMGAANAVSTNARQYRMTRGVARAILDAEEHYNTDSNGLAKYNKVWETTADEMEILKKGSPFSSLFGWALKSRTADPDSANPSDVIFDQEAFNKRSVDRVNFTSMNQTNALNAQYQRYMARSMGHDISDGFNWDDIFANLPQVSNSTHAGKLTNRLRDLRLSQIKGEFLAFDDSLVEEQRVLSANAQGEIAKEVMADDTLKTDRERLNEFNRRFREAGGYVVANQMENGLTKKNILSNPELAADIAAFEGITGTSAYAQGSNVSMVNLPDIQTLMKVQAENARTKLAQLERERAEKQRELEAAQNRAPLTQEQQVEQDQRLADRDRLIDDITQEVIQDRIADPSQRERLDALQEQEQQNNARLRELDPKPFVQREVESLDEQIARQKAEVEKADAAARTAFDYFKSQSEYQRIISDAQEFSSQLYRSVGSKDAKLNGTSRARLFYDQQHGIANAHLRQLEHLALSGDLDFEQRQEVSKLAERINANVDKEFASKAVLNASGLLEDLNVRADKALGLHDPQLQELEAFEDKIAEANEYKKIQLEMAKDPSGKYTEDERKGFISQAASVRSYVNQSRKKFNEYEGLLQAEYEEGYEDRLHQMRAIATGQDRSPEEQSRVAERRLRKQMDAERKNVEKAYRKGWLTDEQREARLAELDKIDIDEYSARILEEGIVKEDLRLARAKRQDARLRAQANKLLRGDQAKQGTYFDRAEALRQQKVDQQDILIEGYNAAIQKRKQELGKLSPDSEAYQATKNEIASLEVQRTALQTAQTRLESPAAILEDLNAFQKALSGFSAQSPVQSLVSDFESVEASIESARNAYQEFADSMAAKQANGEILTAEEQAALDQGYIKLAEIERAANPIITARRGLANQQELDYLNSLLHPGLEQTPEQNAKQATQQYRNSVVSTVAALKETDGAGNYLKFKGLSDDERTRWIDSLDFINFDRYEQDYTDRLRLNRQRDIERREARINRFAEQGGRLRRDAAGWGGNGFASRVVRQWESGKDQYASRIEDLKDSIHISQSELAKHQQGSEQYTQEEARLSKLKQQLSQTQQEAASFAGGMGLAQSATAALAQSVSNLVSQFGRRMFQMAIQEAKRFVQEFDSAMTEIQMITGKTDAEIGQLGDGLIQTALDMKVSVADVTSAAANLYRQGLDDEAVNVRMEDVLKFSKVAKIGAEEASKIITTAQSNDLVSSSEEAMDALVALGDSAATTASEIAKGMQKSAASAKQAGVSYEELVTMLTIITSKTQLGGNQAGTALQTLMYRLYRVNQGDDYYDENGNRVGANDATRALSELGVSVYDDNGNARGAYDILIDVARNWNSASSISQEMVLNALGAGRQRSNIATLIQGLAEDDGALADKYMDLASNSSGITDQKYLSYMDSLEASITNVTTAFDGLIAALVDNGTLTGFLDWIAGVIQGFTNFASSAPGWGQAIAGFAAVLSSLAIVVGAILLAVPGLQGIGAALLGGGIAGAAVTAATVAGIGNSYGKQTKPQTSGEVSDAAADSVERRNNYAKRIAESQSIVEKGGSEALSSFDIATVQGTLDELAAEFGIATMRFTGTAEELVTAANLLKQANGIMEKEFTAKVKKQQEDSTIQAANEVPLAYTPYKITAQTMDIAMRTDFSNSEMLSLAEEGKAYDDTAWGQALGTWIDNNPFLNGKKSMGSYRGVDASAEDRVYYENANIFASWLKSLTSQDFSKVLESYGVTPFPNFDSLPLTYDNLFTLATVPYDELSGTAAYANNQAAWDTAFGGQNGKSNYNMRQQQARIKQSQIWRNSNGSIELVDAGNRSNIEDVVNSRFSEVVDPHVDIDTSRLMKEAFLGRLEAAGYYDALTDSQAYSIFFAAWSDQLTSQFDISTGYVDNAGWASRYLKQTERPVYPVYTPEGQLYRSNLTQKQAQDQVVQLNGGKEIEPLSAEEIQASADPAAMQAWDEQNPAPTAPAAPTYAKPVKPVEPTVVTRDQIAAQYQASVDKGEIEQYVYASGTRRGSKESMLHYYTTGATRASAARMGSTITDLGYDNYMAALATALFNTGLVPEDYTSAEDVLEDQPRMSALMRDDGTANMDKLYSSIGDILGLKKAQRTQAGVSKALSPRYGSQGTLGLLTEASAAAVDRYIAAGGHSNIVAQDVMANGPRGYLQGLMMEYLPRRFPTESHTTAFLDEVEDIAKAHPAYTEYDPEVYAGGRGDWFAWQTAFEQVGAKYGQSDRDQNNMFTVKDPETGVTLGYEIYTGAQVAIRRQAAEILASAKYSAEGDSDAIDLLYEPYRQDAAAKQAEYDSQLQSYEAALQENADQEAAYDEEYAAFETSAEEHAAKRLAYATQHAPRAAGYYVGVPTVTAEGTVDTVTIDNLSDALMVGLQTYRSGDEYIASQRTDAFMEDLIAHNVLTMPALVEYLRTTDSPDLTSILSTVGNGELAHIIDSILVKENGAAKRNADGSFVLTSDTGTQDNAYMSFMSLQAANTANYSNVISINDKTRAQAAQNVYDYFLKGNRLDETQVEFLSGIVGESLMGKLETASAKMQSVDDFKNVADEGEYADGKTRFAVNRDDAGNITGLKTTDANVLAWYNSLTPAQKQDATIDDYVASMNTMVARTALTSDEAAYFNSLVSNAKYGISGLTAAQQMTGINTIMSVIGAGKTGTVDGVSYGGINAYMASRDGSMIDAYMSGIASMPTYIAAAQAIENAPITNADGSEFTIQDLATAEVGSEQYEAADAALQGMGLSAEQALAAMESLNTELMVQGVKAASKYGNATEEVAENMAELKGDARSVANAYKTQNSTLVQATNNQFYRQQYKQGARDSDTVSAIAAMTGLDEETVKEHSDYVESLLDELYESDMETVQNKVSAWDQFLVDEEIAVQLPAIVGEGGSVNLDTAIAGMTGAAAAELQSLADALASMGFTASIVSSGDGENMTYKIVVSDFSGAAGRKSGGGGGGGGGGKSATEKLIEEQEREVKLREHKIKMIQFEQTRYANAGELSNQAIMLQHEVDEEQRLIELKKRHLEELKKQLSATKQYSEEWYACADAILSVEEAMAELNNTIDENQQKIEDLEQQILKLHTDLENTVKDEIETRIQLERDMLDGTVTMQDTILEAIRERYRKEWELMQEDMAKKREALEEEMALIDERLQRRKDAEDEAAKHEELVELKRQLAFVSMDSTRTKDQAELRERIRELEEEISWKEAEKEAERQKDSLQDQADAYEDYEEEYQKYLDDWLEDANNFSEEVNKVMAMNQEDMLKWLSENVEQFRLSLKESQDQLIQGWTDTFKQMKGIVDVFWTEIARILSSKDTFLEYMRQSQAYQNASDDEKLQMDYTWSNMYDDWVSAKKESEEAKDYNHPDENDDEADKKAPAKNVSAYYGGQDSSGGWVTGGAYTSVAAARTAAEKKGLTHIVTSTNGRPSQPKYKIVSNGSVLATNFSTKDAAQSTISSNIQRWGAIGDVKQIDKWEAATVEQYARGGYVDYTGLAMVHGSSSHPEAFLSADDTALMRAMLDSWQLVLKRPTINNIDAALGRGNSGTTFGDLSITITEASFADDADIEEVARRVGDAFTKELSKQGFRTATFNF